VTSSNDPLAIRDLQTFDSAEAALARVQELYTQATKELCGRFAEYAGGEGFEGEVRACYPWIQVRVEREAELPDPRIAYGYCQEMGVYGTTLTRPDLFAAYYREQLEMLLEHHGGVIEVGVSGIGIPVHFAFREDIAEYTRTMTREKVYAMRHHFDVPDLAFMSDDIVNGTQFAGPGEAKPLAPFTGPRVDYSLHRLRHYTGTSPEHFQRFVLFTNYQFYVEEFVRYGRSLMERGEAGANSEYTAFVEPGNLVTPNANLGTDTVTGEPPPRLPQMPAYHLKRADGEGITLVNIGVGPSNAKTITDHIAVLRPHCWLMLGHCAGLSASQRLGDYALAHAYLREDHVLDADLPVHIPLPAIAEVQRALEQAVAEITGFDKWNLKRLMRTGTVATVDDRNWELRDYKELQQRFNQSRAIALDMESATIAANGFRFRVPYGTLLCVSDKPLHGEIKLPGMADHFYRERVNQHLQIGLLTMESLRKRGPFKLHSRKLRTFTEPPFR